MALNWNDLAILIELERGGGAKAAAKTLGTSHQTVTRQLRNLEASLGLRLIDTSGRHWTLTTKGQEVLKFARRMEDHALEVERFSHAETEAFTGRVGISSVAWGIELIVLPALAEVRAQHPKITFDLISADGQKSVEAGEIDIAVRFIGSPPQDLIGTEICPVELGVYGLQDHIERLDVEGPHGVPLVTMESFQAHLDLARVLEGSPMVVAKVNDLTSQLQSILCGLGVGVLPRAIASRYPALKQSTTVPIAGRSKVWVLRHQDSRGSNKVSAVQAEIVKSARRFFGVAAV